MIVPTLQGLYVFNIAAIRFVVVRPTQVAVHFLDGTVLELQIAGNAEIMNVIMNSLKRVGETK